MNASSINNVAATVAPPITSQFSLKLKNDVFDDNKQNESLFNQ